MAALDHSPRLIRSGYLIPNPMPGETIRSFRDRFHRAAPMATLKETLEEMFGPEARGRFGHRLPPRIAQLSRRVGSDHPLSDVRHAMEQHTILPYTTYFHTTEQREQAYTLMLGNKGAAATVAVMNGGARDAVDYRIWPSFCPVCTRADFAAHGFSYWRVVHQLPAVLICPWHHCALREVRAQNNRLTEKTFLWPPEPDGDDLDSYPRVEHPAIRHEHLVRLAEASVYVQERPAGFPGDWRISMLAVLREMGLRSRNGIDHRAVAELITQAHGQEMLEWLGVTSPGSPLGGRPLARTLGFQRARRTTIIYLAIALAIRRDLPTLEAEMAALQAEPGRRKNEFLPSWMPGLAKDWDAGNLSVKKLAKKYRCTQAMIRRYLVRLGKPIGEKRAPLAEDRAIDFFAAAREGKTTTELRKQFKIAADAVQILLERDSEARQIVDRADYMRSRDIFRARAIRTLKANPGITAESLAKKLSNISQKLRRYDASWCDEHLPRPSKLGRWGTNGRSVEELDQEVAIRVRRVIRLMAEDEGMQFFSDADVLARCRATALAWHFRGQLPLTDAALRAVPSALSQAGK